MSSSLKDSPSDFLASWSGTIQREQQVRLEQVLSSLHLKVGDRSAHPLPAGREQELNETKSSAEECNGLTIPPEG